jgi:two-component system chemotaxis sensor kinase CheA
VDTSKYAALFTAESRDHLQQCNHQLLAWERDPGSREPVQALFRSVHTLKGMSATLGYSRLANLAHALEHVLGAARDGLLVPSAELLDAGFRTIDRLEHGVELAIAGQDAALDVDGLIAELGQLARPETGTWPIQLGRREAEPSVPAQGVAVRIRLRPGTVMPGARALLILRQAEALGPVSAVQPPPETWSGNIFLGEFTCRVSTEADDATIRRRLRDVGDIEEVVVERGIVATPASGGGPRQVRVELGRLDDLVTLAGELVVARTRLTALLDRHGSPALEEEGHRLSRLVGQLQEQVLRVRMAPVAEVFERFPRSVRDLARQLGKRIRVDLEGGDIELDRSILDRLPDVLLHLVRNAADHGLETETERRRAGKPLEGVIRLCATRERNAVRIDIEDDGRGINREAVLARAAAEGWAADDPAGLGGAELLRILARPGFSTAAQVTDVSGRGVGIDAVVHQIRALGGSTELSSRAGAGTTVSLRLPLTVAIIPALLVGVEQERYAVPLGYVAEAARLDPDTVRIGVLQFRGRPVPLVDLGRNGTAGQRRAGVILDVGGRQGALLVDTLLGQEDIVVGPVDAPRGTPRWVNGATILSDGVPALVLDPTALV